jgi:hypothetical protein
MSSHASLYMHMAAVLCGRAAQAPGRTPRLAWRGAQPTRGRGPRRPPARGVAPRPPLPFRGATEASLAPYWLTSMSSRKRKRQAAESIKREKTASRTSCEHDTASASSSKLQRGRKLPLQQRARLTKHIIARSEPCGFSLALLREELDAERRRRKLSWTAATRQINREDEGCVWKYRIAVSSVSKVGLNKSGVAEGDGVLQMLVWLKRAPESFIDPKLEGANSHELPKPVGKQILRWDTTALHAALDRKRIEMEVSWSDLASAIGGGWTASALTRLAKGGRVMFPGVMRLVLWIGQPSADFTTFRQHPTEV